MVKFKEFLVGELVEIKKTKTYHKLIVEEYKGFGKPINYVTRTTFNNAVEMLAVCEDNFIINDGHDIIFGAESAKFYYQEEPYITGDKIYKMGVKNKYVGLYLASLFTALIKDMGFSYSNGLIPKRLESLTISVPITPEGTPDYAYMETFIKEMQREYIDSVLETNSIERNRLLSIVGLDQDEYERIKGNIELVDAESYGEFKIGDLFDSHLGKQVDYSNIGKYKVVSGVTENNGVLGYTDSNNHAVYENCLTVSNRGEYCGTAYIQKEPFVLSNNVIALVPKSEITFSFLLFFATCINKLNYGGYSGYPTKAGILNDVIKLPTTSTGEVDYAYMEDYISKIKLIYIYNRELSVNEQVRLLESLITEKELVETK